MNNEEKTLNTNDIENIFKKSIEKYGKEAQCRQAMEECAELIQAINKCLRYPTNEDCLDNLVEEIADVLIMIYQLRVMFEITEDKIIEVQEKKAEREMKRLGIAEPNYKERFEVACSMLATICDDKAGCFDTFECPFKDKGGFCGTECEKEEEWKKYFLEEGENNA